MPPRHDGRMQESSALALRDLLCLGFDNLSLTVILLVTVTLVLFHARHRMEMSSAQRRIRRLEEERALKLQPRKSLSLEASVPSSSGLFTPKSLSLLSTPIQSGASFGGLSGSGRSFTMSDDHWRPVDSGFKEIDVRRQRDMEAIMEARRALLDHASGVASPEPSESLR